MAHESRGSAFPSVFDSWWMTRNTLFRKCTRKLPLATYEPSARKTFPRKLLKLVEASYSYLIDMAECYLLTRST